MPNKRDSRFAFVGSCTMVYDTTTKSYTVWLAEYGTVTGYPNRSFFDATYLMNEYIRNLKRFNAEEIRRGYKGTNP